MAWQVIDSDGVYPIVVLPGNSHGEDPDPLCDPGIAFVEGAWALVCTLGPSTQRPRKEDILKKAQLFYDDNTGTKENAP